MDNKANRSRFMEVYIKRGRIGNVFGVEVSQEQYLIFTTERREKDAVQYYVKQVGNYMKGVDAFIKDLNHSGLSVGQFSDLVNKKERTQKTLELEPI